MTWIVLAFLVYLLVIVWVQVDNSWRSPKEAAFNTFVAPWIYFFLGIPYFTYRGARFAWRWVWAMLKQ